MIYMELPKKPLEQLPLFHYNYIVTQNDIMSQKQGLDIDAVIRKYVERDGNVSAVCRAFNITRFIVQKIIDTNKEKLKEYEKLKATLTLAEATRFLKKLSKKRNKALNTLITAIPKKVKEGKSPYHLAISFGILYDKLIGDAELNPEDKDVTINISFKEKPKEVTPKEEKEVTPKNEDN